MEKQVRDEFSSEVVELNWEYFRKLFSRIWKNTTKIRVKILITLIQTLMSVFIKKCN